MVTPLIKREELVTKQTEKDTVGLEAARKKMNDILRGADRMPITFKPSVISDDSRVVHRIIDELKRAGYPTTFATDGKQEHAVITIS